MKIKKYLKDSPIFSIFDLHQSLLQTSTPLLKKEGLSFMQSLVLITILLEGKSVTTPSQLCQALNLSKAGISHIISNLESKGFLKRMVKEEDARSLKLILTQPGIRKANKLVKILDLFEKGLEEDLGIQRLSLFLSGLEDFKKCLNSSL
ncbi:MAG: MarR family transcriptional regulator [Deltaproteobacteria bacterium]|nr:MAG: MarR family transcriptional regulator [Deltaproteobacteria bacterium]